MADAASEAAGAKRKRGITERTSPDTRRSKRSGGPASDAQTAALIQSAVNAVDAVSHAEMNNVNPADFVALQKAAADHTSDHETSPDAAAASSTAAAALGTMYPNLHVGPPAEESFSQDNEPADTSYNPEVTQQQPAAETSTISIPQPNGMPAPPAYNIKPKPVVGSQEWHKLRKDNHKEGSSSACPADRVLVSRRLMKI